MSWRKFCDVLAETAGEGAEAVGPTVSAAESNGDPAEPAGQSSFGAKLSPRTSPAELPGLSAVSAGTSPTAKRPAALAASVGKLRDEADTFA